MRHFEEIMALKDILLIGLIIAGVLFFFGFGKAGAADTLSLNGLQKGKPGIVARVIDGDTVHLADGRKVRLLGIQAPELHPAPDDPRPAEPWAKQSSHALTQLLLHKEVALYYGPTRKDKFGRHLAHIVRAEDKSARTPPIWVQTYMLENGHARAYLFADNPVLSTELLQAESNARENNMGLWALKAYRIANANRPPRHLHGFQIVQGRILHAEKVGNTIYWNFGKNWKTDFTIAIKKKYWPRFDHAPFPLNDWNGKSVRVRGWVFDKNGPMMQPDSPIQIEWLQREDDAH
jgi:endonuclease YncB( thermonuclease family)